MIYSFPGFFEPFSAITHLIGAVTFLCLMPFLIRRGQGERKRVWFLVVYAVACVFLLSMSGVYHMMDGSGTARIVMRHLDQGAIFILIAGTFTAAHGVLFRRARRWIPLVLLWTLAITAVTLTTVFREGIDDSLNLLFYLGMGWVGVISAIAMARRYGLRFIGALIAGGIAYTVGAVMELLDWFVVIPGVVHAHELFHVAVLVGIACHWRFVWRVAAGPPGMQPPISDFST